MRRTGKIENSHFAWHTAQAGFLLLHKLMDGFGDFQSVLIAHAKHLNQNRRLAVKQPFSVRLRKKRKSRRDGLKTAISFSFGRIARRARMRMCLQ